VVCGALRREAGGVPERLSDDEVAAGLAGLQWDRDGDELVKVVTRKDFGEAMQFVNAVALLAEGANHHPDIAISWNRVTLRVTTHDAGGLSRMDLDLAAAIDDLG
jgi:4a-hydroxytetrahydrobiopterin dehydratase